MARAPPIKNGRPCLPKPFQRYRRHLVHRRELCAGDATGPFPGPWLGSIGGAKERLARSREAVESRSGGQTREHYRQPLGRATTGADLAHGHLAEAEIASSRRTYGGIGSP